MEIRTESRGRSIEDSDPSFKDKRVTLVFKLFISSRQFTKITGKIVIKSREINIAHKKIHIWLKIYLDLYLLET